ncbi:MAG: TIGR03118 family protein [Chloroflexi bacterium]|nr:MAG: TIGR03118 family protein [Chloroflexota bacterium]TME93689.1 MAG: TIGR03118 family protein [Chloroflexota bacterium]
MAWLRSSGSKTSTALAGVWVAFTLVAMPVAAGAGGYTETDLASDLPDRAPHMDSSLVNPWGLVSGPTTPWWTSDNGTGMSTLLKADGSEFAAPFNPVNIPMTDCAGAGTPTGVVFDGTSSFTFNDCDGVARHGRFMFATEDGSIVAWDAPLKTAVTVVDPSSAAVYKGLAIGSNDQGTFLYATNFRAGSVDVFNTSFQHVTLSGSFSDPGIKRGFAPFGIANLGGDLYVTYARQDATLHDDVAGPANGFVDVFDTNGNLLRRAATRGRLNSPWGVAIAPANFGRFSGDLLVGNFGDGRINAIDPLTGEFLGQLRGPDNRPLVIDGLWAIVFGTGSANSGPTNALFFTAGLEDESHGLFGRIDPTS